MVLFMMYLLIFILFKVVVAVVAVVVVVAAVEVDRWRFIQSLALFSNESLVESIIFDGSLKCCGDCLYI